MSDRWIEQYPNNLNSEIDTIDDSTVTDLLESAVNKFSSPLSGKNLPFSSLSDKLKKKKEE